MLLLDTLAELSEHARSVNADRLRRRALAIAQLADKARSTLLHRAWQRHLHELPIFKDMFCLQHAGCSTHTTERGHSPSTVMLKMRFQYPTPCA